MKKIRTIRPLATLLLIFFLGNSIISCPLDFFNLGTGEDSASLAKSAGKNSPSEADFPFEEKEKEAKDVTEEYQDNFFLIGQANESAFSYASAARFAGYRFQHSFCYTPPVPLYLTQRTLLI